MSRPPSTNTRAHRARTDRNLLLGFFALLFIVGGGLIWYFYGAGAAALGVACMALGAVLVYFVDRGRALKPPPPAATPIATEEVA